jgi:succinyl-diaminopimelate desuccinylase
MMNNQLKEAFLKDLKQLITFPSVLAEPVGDYPYGQPIGAALEWFLVLGKAYLFKSVNVDHQAGYIEFGKGEEVGILGHLDVVLVGDGCSIQADNRRF